MPSSKQPDSYRVAVIVNKNSPDSLVIARHYLKRRRIPGRNVIHISCPPGEVIADDLCQDRIIRPARAYLQRTGLDAKIDFLVTTRGVPLLTTSGLSVDGLLMTLDVQTMIGSGNPYFNERRAFSHRRYNLYLCTRLDGYTIPEAKALVDRSLAARRREGTFLLDIDPRRVKPPYSATNEQMRAAAAALKAKGFTVRLDTAPTFVGHSQKLMGYFSWGSNDGAFSPQVYASLGFLPGALAETAVSTSARTLRATSGGQSLIADLVSQGVTGVKGYVAEPFLHAVARPDILFPCYVAGRNLAESFYAASAQIRWRDIVLGDPLCAPYATRA